MKKYIGIKINQESFTAAFPRDYNQKYDLKTYNNTDGEIQRFVKSLADNFTCILENRGIYSAVIGNYIFKAGFHSCIVHPVQMERFALTRFFKQEYDPVIISKYGDENTPELYQPTPDFIKKISDSWDSLRLLLHTRLGKRKKIHALENSFRSDTGELEHLKKTLAQDEFRINQIEEELDIVVNKFISPYSL